MQDTKHPQEQLSSTSCPAQGQRQDKFQIFHIKTPLNFSLSSDYYSGRKPNPSHTMNQRGIYDLGNVSFLEDAFYDLHSSVTCWCGF